MTRICVLGLGYIGLPTAAMFGTHGYQVIGVDVNPRVVKVLGDGEIHIEEPGLRTLVEAALRSGHLRVSNRPEEADAFIIAVPTPLETGTAAGAGADLAPRADLGAVRTAAESIVPFLRPGNLVVLESTSPPGTTRDVLCPILEQSGLKTGRDLHVAYSPERVLPGRVLEELISNDRVIGGIDAESCTVARDLYSSFVDGNILLTSSATAEMVKLMENTYRDVNIALANEFALIAEHVGIDVWEAIRMANRHPRVNILRPGPGVGGHCIAVDPWFVVEAAPHHSALIKKAREINDAMPGHVIHLVKSLMCDIPQPVVACLGATYKADIDDVRESPAITIIKALAATVETVRVFDPHMRDPLAAPVVTAQSLGDAVRGADCMVILTDHAEFRNLTPSALAEMRRRHVVDTRGCLSGESWAKTQFAVTTLGKASDDLRRCRS